MKKKLVAKRCVFKSCLNVIFQDSIDLFLGNFAVDETDGPTPLRVQKDWKFLTVSSSNPNPNPERTFISSLLFLLLAVAHHYAGGFFHVHRLSPHGW